MCSGQTQLQNFEQQTRRKLGQMKHPSLQATFRAIYSSDEVPQHHGLHKNSQMLRLKRKRPPNVTSSLNLLFVVHTSNDLSSPTPTESLQVLHPLLCRISQTQGQRHRRIRFGTRELHQPLQCGLSATWQEDFFSSLYFCVSGF